MMEMFYIMIVVMVVVIKLYMYQNSSNHTQKSVDFM